MKTRIIAKGANRMRQTILAAAMSLAALPALAGEATTYPFDGTGTDVGSDVKIFEAADIFLFCSATLSREVMEADPMNIAHCPYGIFVAERDGAVMIGYRNMPDGEMQKVQAFLDEIVQDALE
jgi:hypothetical protein